MEDTSSVKMNVRSGIWEYFSIVGTDKTRAKCIKCGTMVSRGRNLQKLTNSSMIHHLSAKHPEQKKTEEREKARKHKKEEIRRGGYNAQKTKKQRLMQPTLAEMKDKTKIWDINDPKLQKITRLIGKSPIYFSCL